MDSRDWIEQVQKEHLEIVLLADKLAGALALASKNDFAAKQQSLAGLREAWDGLLGLRQHCGSEEGFLESDYHHYLDAQQYAQLRKEHQVIARLVAGLLRELPFATADSVRDICPEGNELVERLREHVAFEEDMLWRVEERRLQYQ